MGLVREWGKSVPRSYFAAGVGKSTEDAVGRLLLASEGIEPTQEAACFIWDIDKCYEHVDHARLQKAAVLHKFPLALVRLCISMYRAQRTVAWGGIYSTFVRSNRTLVPGCSIALWLLQLLMITPIDNYLLELPREVRTPVFFC